MLETSQAKSDASQKFTQHPRCLEISEKGIETAQQFAQFMSALMSDVIAGRISPQKASASTTAGGKLLKVVEMKYRYGENGEGYNGKSLKLVE